MWPAIGVGSGFLVLLGIVLSMQNVKINKAATRELCEERTQDFKRSLKSGNERFDKNDTLLTKLTEKVNTQNGVLIEVRTILKRMEKNGHGP